jgi:amino acid transporter
MADQSVKAGDCGVESKGAFSAQPDIERVATTSTELHGSTTAVHPDNVGYHRSLTRRKVMMMTFGAGIGTGLWVGTGQALHYGESLLIGMARRHTNGAMV